MPLCQILDVGWIGMRVQTLLECTVRIPIRVSRFNADCHCRVQVGKRGVNRFDTATLVSELKNGSRDEQRGYEPEAVYFYSGAYRPGIGRKALDRRHTLAFGKRSFIGLTLWTHAEDGVSLLAHAVLAVLGAQLLGFLTLFLTPDRGIQSFEIEHSTLDRW